MHMHHEHTIRSRALRIAMAIPLGLAILACTACNTTKGVGKDVEAAGEGLQEVADDSKDAMTD